MSAAAPARVAARSGPAPGAGARLRAATRSRHARLEAITGLPGSLRTPADLVATLEDLHGFHAAVEAQPTPEGFWEGLGLTHCAASRRAWLAEDLVRLGVAPARVRALPPCPGIGPFANVSGRLGCAWVVEGSALGGRVLRAHLDRHAERFPGVPGRLRFLEAHGADGTRLWRRFGEVLEAGVARGGGLRDDGGPPGRIAVDEDALVDAARATFDALIDWFARRAEARRR